jgi:hypothetical protein
MQKDEAGSAAEADKQAIASLYIVLLILKQY